MSHPITRRAFLGAAAALAASAAPAKPNVLILLADDLGWHDIGYHGAEIRTPNIDRLATQGTRFERAYSFPVCSPTRSGFMTGRSPMRLGTGYTVIRPWSSFGIPTEERFLPQAFHDAGYQTSMAGKWHLGHAYKKFLPFNRGFDNTYGHVNGAIDYFTHERDGGLDWSRNGVSVREEGYSTFLFGDETIKRIRTRDKTRPFFHYLAFNAPHEPLQAPPALIDSYAHIKDIRRRRYCAMTDALDQTIGRVLATLDEEGIAGNTLVLFFSDNGGPIIGGATNTPLRGAKASTFEGGIRVPTVMRWPGKIKAGALSNQVMTMMDYYPTMAAAAGIDPGPHRPFDGRTSGRPSSRAGKSRARTSSSPSMAQPGSAMRFTTANGNWSWMEIRPCCSASSKTPTRLPTSPPRSPNWSRTSPRSSANRNNPSQRRGTPGRQDAE